jgi:hypothetical protein
MTVDGKIAMIYCGTYPEGYSWRVTLSYTLKFCILYYRKTRFGDCFDQDWFWLVALSCVEVLGTV